MEKFMKKVNHIWSDHKLEAAVIIFVLAVAIAM